MRSLHARGRDRGAAAVEFALILPPLIALLVGAVAFGNAYRAQYALTNAARDVARAVASDYNDPGADTPAVIADETLGDLGYPTCGDAAWATCSVAADECLTGSAPDPRDVTVILKWDTTLAGGIGEVTLAAKSKMPCDS